MKLLICILSVAAIAMANDVARVFRDATNQFTARMFDEVLKQHQGKSVIASPFSVMSPLAQLGFASVGESHDELLQNIGMPNDNVTKAAFSGLKSLMKSSKGIELRMANNIYIPKGEKLNNEFAALSRDVFSSGVEKVDFLKNVETAKTINTWVEDQTNHRIKDLVNPESLGADTRAVLVNAIYFKGTWQTPFNKRATYDGDFHVSRSQVVKVPTMYNKDHYSYGESKELNAQLLEIPYDGEEASFLIVLPREGENFDQFLNKLRNPAVLDRAIENMVKTEVEIHIPKFKIETTTDLKQALVGLGITKLFTPGQARLDNLLENSDDLYVSDAKQKAFIEINEEGAEAAAANVFHGFSSSGLPAPPAKLFLANRPFYYLIQRNFIPLFNGVKM